MCKGLGVKNMSGPVLKQIYSIYKTKNLTKEQIKKYKMTEREIFQKYGNLKTFMLEMMSWLLLLNVSGAKKIGEKKKNRCVQKKLMIPESEISKWPEHEVK